MGYQAKSQCSAAYIYTVDGVCSLLSELQSYTGRVPVVGDASLLTR